MSNNIYTNDTDKEDIDIYEKLFALEKGDQLSVRESYRVAIRNHQNYLIPFLTNQAGIQTIYKIPSDYNFESIPIFLSQDVFSSLRDDYLKKYGYLDLIEEKQERLNIKTISGKELFELIPKSSLSSFFVLPAEDGEFRFNFNLADVFRECFFESQTEFDLEFLIDNSQIDNSELTVQENSNLVGSLKKSATQEIEVCQKFRKLFEPPEWIVLTTQPTSNKLLKGEVSRDDFDLDRYDDKKIVIFSDLPAFEQYKIATGQTEVKIYHIKVESKRIFGSDLSKYNLIFVNPNPPQATIICQEKFLKINELFTAYKIENTLSQINKFRIGYGKDYIEVKDFQRFIIPLDMRINAINLPSLNLPVHFIQDDHGNRLFPIFTAKDCFEMFRLHCLEKSNPDDANFIEPYLIIGEKLFDVASLIKTQVIFNSFGPIHPITFEPNFALKVYCA